ncbi:MAG: HAMP domain-containing sensor histidine kinase [Clostridium sp.]|nr:HAMP domain-containing sensor histidine kinase [Clostridium sp.]
MGRLKKEKSISKLFRSYIIMFVLLVSAEFIVISLSFILGMYTGSIRPANYYEQIIEKNRTEIACADISEVKDLIPEPCAYSIYDSNGIILDTNRNIDFAHYMWNIASDNKISGNGYYYKVITRDNDEICIAGYTLNAFFSNKYMDKYMPGPEATMIIMFFILFLCGIIIISKQFGKRLSKEMKILNETTDNITMENLNFKINYSSVKEINNVLSALDKMKKQLNDSLQRQWRIEEMRKSQIGALAHDIKTPLTIIKGNSELLSELNLNSEQSVFNDGIINEADTIENYLKTLLEIMNSEKFLNIQKETIYTGEFLKDLINTSSCICSNKKIKFITEIHDLPDEIEADPVMLKRALLNIISNAIDYSPEEGKLYFSAARDNKYINFIIEDGGRGFTKEEIKYATEQFYQGDKSRNSKSHYGMGLYIAQKFIQNHNGTIELSNSEKLCGAKVTVSIPIQ